MLDAPSGPCEVVGMNPSDNGAARPEHFQGATFQTTPSPRPHAVRPGGAIGFSITLTPDQRLHAIRRRGLELAKSRGIDLPIDEVDFMARAEVHEQPDGSVAVTMEM